MLHTFYFSASGTTDTIVKAIADSFGTPALNHNLTPQSADVTLNLLPDDVVLFAAPVYGGRLPMIAVEKFRQIKGNGQKCIAVAVYGNRDYDDALVELCDLLSDNGFDIIAAGAFIARHCIFPAVATSRPDNEDLLKISDFAAEVKSALEKGLSLDLSSVKGNRPYKKAAGVPLHPKVDKRKCGKCGRCVRECPARAIPADNPHETDASKCISCSLCITVCPEQARHFGGLMYAAIAPLFKKKCSARREPEWFIAK